MSIITILMHSLFASYSLPLSYPLPSYLARRFAEVSAILIIARWGCYMKPWEEVAAKIHGGYPLEVSKLAMETGPFFVFSYSNWRLSIAIVWLPEGISILEWGYESIPGRAKLNRWFVSKHHGTMEPHGTIFSCQFSFFIVVDGHQFVFDNGWP